MNNPDPKQKINKFLPSTRNLLKPNPHQPLLPPLPNGHRVRLPTHPGETSNLELSCPGSSNFPFPSSTSHQQRHPSHRKDARNRESRLTPISPSGGDSSKARVSSPIMQNNDRTPIIAGPIPHPYRPLRLRWWLFWPVPCCDALYPPCGATLDRLVLTPPTTTHIADERSRHRHRRHWNQ